MASTILNANSVNVTASGTGGGNFTGSGSSSYSTPGGTVTIYTTSGTNGTSLTVPSSSYMISNGGSAYNSWGTITTTAAQPSITVTGDADIAGNLKVGGKDIGKTLEAIEKRLAILTPDPNKLEKFEALKKAYEHYKLMEALCHEEKESGS